MKTRKRRFPLRKQIFLAKEICKSVQEFGDELKAKHGGVSGPQYRLRAEPSDVNQHDSMDNLPLRSKFKKQASSVPCGSGLLTTAIASMV